MELKIKISDEKAIGVLTKMSVPEEKAVKIIAENEKINDILAEIKKESLGDYSDDNKMLLYFTFLVCDAACEGIRNKIFDKDNEQV